MSWLAAAGAVGGGILGINSAKREAERNRNFQQYMSSTAHQREVRDLRAAGLNPILSATGGNGASTPAGGMAPISQSLGSDAVSAYNSAKQVQIAQQTAGADIALKNAQAVGSIQSAKESVAKTSAIQQDTGINADKYKFEKDYREMDKYLDRAVKASSAGSNVLNMLPNSAKGLNKDLFNKNTTDAAKKLLRKLP